MVVGLESVILLNKNMKYESFNWWFVFSSLHFLLHKHYMHTYMSSNVYHNVTVKLPLFEMCHMPASLKVIHLMML